MAKRMRFILSTIMVIVAMTAKAQVTTASLSGKVTDPTKEAIIGATVQAIHEPSGTRYGAITNIDGRYTIQGMRAGGPYSVEVSYIGYQTMMFKDVTLQLGEVYNLNVQMQESSELLDESRQLTKFRLSSLRLTYARPTSLVAVSMPLPNLVLTLIRVQLMFITKMKTCAVTPLIVKQFPVLARKTSLLHTALLSVVQ